MAFKPVEILINAKDNASAVFGSLQTKVAAVGAAIATYFGINAFAGVVRGAADLETAMSRVQAATGATGDQMAALRKAAEDAGASTKFTSAEAAAALENLAKAGLDAGQAIDTLPAVLNTAQAADVGLAEASEMVTKAVMGMGLQFSEAGRVADVLALGANATNTSITGLSQALSYAAPVANSLGLSLEATAAIIGKFADAGIDASRAGTALNSILSQFSDPASKFRTELASAGITTTDFEKALHQLAAAGPAGSKAILAVGQEAGPALRALLNQGMGALDELKAKLDNAAGSAAATAATMQNNLNGAMSGLSSAWDTVKNALGTPVLPVLKDGVDQLAAAFRAAVADGTVGRFGEAIATAFQAGIKWVREFLGTVDFSAALARMQAFADSANQFFVKVGEYATNAGNTVQLAYGVMSAGTNAVLTAIYGIGSAFTGMAGVVMEGVAKLRDGLASVTFGGLSESFRLAAEDARSMAQGFSDAAQAMRDKATESMQGVADGAQLARAGFAGLAGAINTAETATSSGAAAMQAMARELQATADATAKTIEATSRKAQQDAAAKQAAQEHAAAIAGLSAEYGAAVSSGNWQRAAELQEQLNQKLRETPAAAKDAARAAADTAAAIEASFRALGVTSSAELTKTATEAQRAYETIKASGTSTAQDIANAFRVAAERAIAANDGIAPAWVRSQAAVRGFRVEADDTGKSVLRSMQKAEESVHRVGRAAHGTLPGFRAMGAAAGEASKNLQILYDRHRLLSNEESKRAVEDARGAVSGNAALTKEYIESQIAKRWGDEFIGDQEAMELFDAQIKLNAYRTNYGNVVRSQESLNEQHALLEKVQRLEERLRQRQAQGGTSASQEPPPRTATQSGPADTAGSRAGRMQTGMAPQVVNLNIGGVRLGAVNTDQAGRQALERFVRELSNFRGVS